MYNIFEYEYFSEVISVLALLISIASFMYARLANRFSVEVSDTYRIKQASIPNLIFFTVTNVSIKAIKIENVELFNADNQLIKHLNYDPQITYKNVPTTSGFSLPMTSAQPANWEYQNPFSELKVLTPNEKVEYSYYVSSKDIPTSLKISANKRIKGFKKEKLVSIDFPERK